jgi:plastocyanin
MIARTFLALVAVTVINPNAPTQGARSARSHVVTLRHIAFHPRTLTIQRDESITWLWEDRGIAHNVAGHGFRSATRTHGSFTVRFPRTGVFNYRCTIHQAEGMTGTVVVR